MIHGLPEKLKELRVKYKYTQREVAERMNVSASVVAGYEQGNRCPSTEILCRLADIYQCSTDYLLGREPDKHQIILDVNGLTAQEIEAVSHLVDSMKRTDAKRRNN